MQHDELVIRFALCLLVIYGKRQLSICRIQVAGALARRYLEVMVHQTFLWVS